MKKMITILAVLTVAGAALATESAPSNTVGFVSTNVGDQVKSHITIQPMGDQMNADFDAVIGDQMVAGYGPYPYGADLLETYVLDPGGDFWGYTYNDLVSGTWINYAGITGIDFNRSYMLTNYNGVGNATKVWAGDVVPEGTVLDMGTMVSGTSTDPKRNFVSNPLPMQRVISGETGDIYNLIASGFTTGYPGVGDVLEHYDATTGNWDSAFFDPYGYPAPSWISYTGMNLDPGMGYIVTDASAGTDWNWSFTVGTDVVATAPASDAKTKVGHSAK